MVNTISHQINSKYIVHFQPSLEQVGKPHAAGAFKSRPANPTAFRKFYERGDFPIALEHDTKGNKIAWKVRLLFK
jgi:hypothetical protein